MTFKEKINAGKYLITGEVGPPKGIGLDHLFREAESFKGRVDAINVTDIQSSCMRVGSLAVSYLLRQKGYEPIFQATCRDRNRLALQSDILSASVLGIENILILTGDHPGVGDHPQAKPVFDLNSVQLLQAAKGLTDGHDMAGNKLDGVPPKYCLGAVVNPGADPIEPEILRLEKKVAAGAEFVQTQAVYEPEKFKVFMDMVRHINVPILAGVVVLKSASMAKYMNEHVAGVFVPQRLIEEMESTKKEDRQKKAVEVSVRLIGELKPLCRGIHLMPLGWGALAGQILDGARL